MRPLCQGHLLCEHYTQVSPPPPSLLPRALPSPRGGGRNELIRNTQHAEGNRKGRSFRQPPPPPPLASESSARSGSPPIEAGHEAGRVTATAVETQNGQDGSEEGASASEQLLILFGVCLGRPRPLRDNLGHKCTRFYVFLMAIPQT